MHLPSAPSNDDRPVPPMSHVDQHEPPYPGSESRRRSGAREGRNWGPIARWGTCRRCRETSRALCRRAGGGGRRNRTRRLHDASIPALTKPINDRTHCRHQCEEIGKDTEPGRWRHRSRCDWGLDRSGGDRSGPGVVSGIRFKRERDKLTIYPDEHAVEPIQGPLGHSSHDDGTQDWTSSEMEKLRNLGDIVTFPRMLTQQVSSA